MQVIFVYIDLFKRISFIPHVSSLEIIYSTCLILIDDHYLFCLIITIWCFINSNWYFTPTGVLRIDYTVR